MTVTRNTGADLLSLGQVPSYPGPRKQAIKAMRNAQARREREDAQRPYDADRLAQNLADRPPDVRVNDGDGDEATREYLRRMGWTDERLASAQEGLRDDLQRRVHPLTVRSTVTAGAVGLSSGTPAPAVAPRIERASLAGFHIAAARAAGYDPVRLWPSLRGLVASGGPDRPVRPDQAPVEPRTPRLAGSTPQPANRRAPGGRAMRRTVRR
jgi:hypothetical protein